MRCSREKAAACAGRQVGQHQEERMPAPGLPGAGISFLYTV